MKRTGNLYHLIVDPANLRLAFWKAAKGKRCRPEVIAFQADLDTELARLRDALLARRPPLGHYHFFHVHDPKRRLICAASFAERVLHHALMNVCEPYLDACAIHDSYACRQGKGTIKAIARAQELTRHCQWYLKIDIRKYFDSIDHATLLGLLASRFKDRDLLDLFQGILATYQASPGCGLPIGNLVSQHLANFYLGHFDHWAKEEASHRHYIRYMDDMLFGAAQKEHLREALATGREVLRQRLKLEIKNNIQLNRCERGIPFLGYRIHPSRILLGAASKQRFVWKFKRYEALWQGGEWPAGVVARRVAALVGFTRVAAADGFRARIIARHGVPS